MTQEQEGLVTVLELSNDLEKLQAADVIRTQDEQLEIMRRHTTACRGNGNAYAVATLLGFIKKWSRHDSHCGLCYGSNDCTCGFWEELDELKRQVNEPVAESKSIEPSKSKPSRGRA